MATTDPTLSIIALLKAQINTAAITEDDDSTLAQFKIMMARPPWVIINDILSTLAFDCAVTVKKIREQPRRMIKGVPYLFVEWFEIGVWTIDKTGITGDELRWKMFKEVRRIARAYPDDMEWFDDDEDDHEIGGTHLYNSNITVKHKTDAT